MPFYETDDIDRFVRPASATDDVWELRGMAPATAIAFLSQMLERCRGGSSRRVLVRIDPATATSGETLFLPVGRRLLEARRQGLVEQFHPLPAAGGFWVALRGPSQAMDVPDSGADR